MTIVNILAKIFILHFARFVSNVQAGKNQQLADLRKWKFNQQGYQYTHRRSNLQGHAQELESRKQSSLSTFLAVLSHFSLPSSSHALRSVFRPRFWIWRNLKDKATQRTKQPEGQSNPKGKASRIRSHEPPQNTKRPRGVSHGVSSRQIVRAAQRGRRGEWRKTTPRTSSSAQPAPSRALSRYSVPS